MAASSLARTNLPLMLPPLIGREREIGDLQALLRSERTKLITLTGPGGTGKTRLAIALAQRAADMYPDGVVFVPLAPIDDPMLVPSTIARVLGLGDLGGRPALDVVVEQIGEKRMLLIIDNFEQVLSAAPVIAELLHRTPSTTVLLTSRAVLHVSGEQEYEAALYKADTTAHTMVAWKTGWVPRDSTPVFTARYEKLDSLNVRIHALIRGDSVHVDLSRTNRHFQLTERQFHWLSEYNR